MTALLWFRRDLRLADHPALHAAAAEGDVLPVFVRDPHLRRAGAARARRLEASLADLHRATDGALVVRSGDPAEVLSDLAAEAGATRVHVTAETTPYGRARDDRVAERLAADGIALEPSGSPYAVPPGTLRTGGGTPYQVFTPFSRAWRDHGAPDPLPVPDGLRWHRGPGGETVEASAAQGAGEEAAQARWQDFLHDDLAGYATDRDRPDRDATSRLSAALKLGELHPRTLLADLAGVSGPGSPASEGARTFTTELCWREFHADVLWHHPGSAWGDLRPALAGLAWDAPEVVAPEVAAWRAGRTGFPFVDAGMRQLLAEGWMHNRVRMVVASFLVKDLHVRWQVGARHFLDHLVDGDLASNNHSWQWVAGTGTDAAPYFRVFNPVTQGKRFDPEGAYVRRWVPELAHLPGRAPHEPWRHPDGYAHGYPEQIVDHGEERREALARYERARESGGER